MKKRLLAGLAVGIMAIAMVGCSGQKAAEPAKGEAEATTQVEATTQAEAAAEDWYKTVLEDENTKAQYPCFALADIDLDGTDERGKRERRCRRDRRLHEGHGGQRYACHGRGCVP